MADERDRPEQPTPAPGENPPHAVAAPTGAEAEFVSLYRRFRPGRFSELRGQPHVVRALLGAVREGRVAHAYLFSGPRGTGKTSAARILARALNCASPEDGEPCGTCTSCTDIARGSSFDVHELDAASNNGVDAMRELIAHAALATPGRWKVYIVDEVHMLSNSAANALLKTLEEPPGHVVFVLATTDPQKVPPTIRSRTQHFEFGLMSAEVLGELLRDVNESAGLGLGEADLAVAVRKGRGSARDALSALDQTVASGSADALRPDVVGLTDALGAQDATRALVGVAALHDAGWGAQQIATELVDELRQGFLMALAPELCGATGPDRERLAGMAERLGLARIVRSIETLGRAQVDMREAPDTRTVLDVALARLARPELDDGVAALLDRVARLERSLAGAPVPPAPGAPPAVPPPAPPEAVPGPGAAAPGTLDERPGLGAYRRRRPAHPAPGETPPDPAPRPGEPAPASAGTGPAPRASAGTGPAGSTTAPASPEPPPVPPEPAPRTGDAQPGRDEIVEAWGDHILRGLPARAKALYSAGRFLATEGDLVTFALPNAAHRDRCEDVRAVVERAIGDHFTATVRLLLVVDDGSTGALDPRSSRSGASDPPDPDAVPGGTGLDPGDEIDPSLPTGSVEAARAFVLEAFPGAEEVSG